MTPWSFVSALLIVLSAADPPSSPEENEVQKYTEVIKSQVSDKSNPQFKKFLCSDFYIKDVLFGFTDMD